MQVTKRSGETQPMDINKISTSLQRLCIKHSIECSYSLVVAVISTRLYNLITTSEISKLAAREASDMDMDRLASAITISSLHKSTGNFLHTSRMLKEAGVTRPEYNTLVEKYGEFLETQINHELDYRYSYLEIKNEVVERPQSNSMRMSLFLYGDDIDSVLESYHCLSRNFHVYGTPD